VIRFIIISLILLSLNGCSGKDKTEIIKTEIKKDEPQGKDLTKLFKKKKKFILSSEKKFKQELNPNLKVEIESKLFKNNDYSNLTNNGRRIDFDSNLESKKKYKFSKVKDFNKSEPNLVFDNNGIFFFKSKGTIIKLDKESKLIWKKNYYNKSEKKLNPILSFATNGKVLIVADNISNYYAINNVSGELLWKMSNTSPFNSQIKIYKDRFYITDYTNTLKSFLIKNGKEIWNYKTDSSFIKSQKKLSIAIKDQMIFFNNSIGDISALNIDDGRLLWQRPTQNSLILENSFLFKNSNLVISKEAIIFSNNKNEFYSLNTNSGNLNWKQKINSNISPIIINDIIFTISNDGYLYLINSLKGNIFRVTDIFQNLKNKKSSKASPQGKDLTKLFKKKKKRYKNVTEPQGFVIAKNKIYMTTSNGYILIIDVKSGKTEKYLKINNSKVSKPIIFKNSIYTLTNKSVIKLN
jgi:outer membrane protein assembly factor BamB